MKQIDYQEIYCTSSEKNIFSGMPGFGIRTCTEGMSYSDAEIITGQCSTGYQVYGDRILDMDRILADPDVVYGYSPAYMYRKVTMTDGRARYVFGRTVYIGVDYGFFKGINAYDRAGTNYFSHLLIFDSEPDIALPGILLDKGAYVPEGWSCTPANRELVGLLTGEPEFLGRKSLAVDTDVKANIAVSHESVPFVQCVLQMFRNRRSGAGQELPVKMIVKAPGKLVGDCLRLLAVFPQECMDGVCYLSNYMQGGGIPDGYDIVFVDEYNEAGLYESNYLTVDLFEQGKLNFQGNVILDKVRDFILSGDISTASSLIRFYLDMKTDGHDDYGFLYSLFAGTEPDMDISLQSLDSQMIGRLGTVHLSPVQEQRLWNKINKCVDGSLAEAGSVEFRQALQVIDGLRRHFPDRLKISSERRSSVTEALFFVQGNLEKTDYGKDIDTILWMVDRKAVEKKMQETLKVILHSGLKAKDRNSLVQKLFPVGKYAEDLFAYFRSFPEDMALADDVMTSMVKSMGERRFSDFVWLAQLNPELKKVIAPVISEYYSSRIGADARTGIESMLEFISRTGVDQMESLGLRQVFETAVMKLSSLPLPAMKKIWQEIQDSGIKLQGAAAENLERTRCLIEKELPEAVDYMFINTAFRIHSASPAYLERLFRRWISTVPESGKIKRLFKENRGMDRKLAGGCILALWQNGRMRSSREDMVLSVTDSCGWGRKDLEAFCAECGDKDLSAFLLKSNSTIKKLFRKQVPA